VTPPGVEIVAPGGLTFSHTDEPTLKLVDAPDEQETE
jgi:hypothetical protein